MLFDDVFLHPDGSAEGLSSSLKGGVKTAFFLTRDHFQAFATVLLLHKMSSISFCTEYLPKTNRVYHWSTFTRGVLCLTGPAKMGKWIGLVKTPLLMVLYHKVYILSSF